MRSHSPGLLLTGAMFLALPAFSEPPKPPPPPPGTKLTPSQTKVLPMGDEEGAGSGEEAAAKPASDAESEEKSERKAPRKEPASGEPQTPPR